MRQNIQEKWLGPNNRRVIWHKSRGTPKTKTGSLASAKSHHRSFKACTLTPNDEPLPSQRISDKRIQKVIPSLARIITAMTDQQIPVNENETYTFAYHWPYSKSKTQPRYRQQPNSLWIVLLD